MKNEIILDLQLGCKNLKTIPNKSTFIRWIQHVFSLHGYNKKIELTIRIVSETESRSLNMYFLKNNFPTNILSFPFYPPIWFNTDLIGDLIICYKIIEYEAKINNIPVENQLAHIVIHGVLHLIGYDHITDDEVKTMENIENTIMRKLGYKH